MKDNKEEWEKEFDEKFPPKFWNYSVGARMLMLTFIHGVLIEERTGVYRRLDEILKKIRS